MLAWLFLSRAARALTKVRAFVLGRQMIVPRYDWELDALLREQRKRNGHDRAFYNSARWRRLRARVLAEFHGESQYELGLEPSRYVPAETVHHVMHVDEYPGWALSEFALDADGNLIRNLIPLSHAAHDIAHGRFGKNVRARAALTDEMW